MLESLWLWRIFEKGALTRSLRSGGRIEEKTRGRYTRTLFGINRYYVMALLVVEACKILVIGTLGYRSGTGADPVVRIPAGAGVVQTRLFTNNC